MSLLDTSADMAFAQFRCFYRSDYEALKAALADGDIQLLKQAVGYLQNSRPLGQADGTVDEDTWHTLRDSLLAFDTFIRNYELVAAKIGINSWSNSWRVTRV